MFPCILRVWLCTHTYPENVSTVGKYTIRGALWSWHAVDAVCAAVRVACALWSGHRGAVGMPLQGAGGRGVACCQSGVYSLERCWWRSGCCCRCCLRVMIEGAAVRVVCAVNPALERACW